MSKFKVVDGTGVHYSYMFISMPPYD